MPPDNAASPLEYVDNTPTRGREEKVKRIRNLTGFWILGLCNNYAYVVMLSAAFDILNKELGPHNPPGTCGRRGPAWRGSVYKGRGCREAIVGVTSEAHPANTTRCNPTSTGAILLADILPALLVKLCAPFFNINTSIQVGAVVLLSCSSFLMTSFTVATWMSFMGVVCAAIGSGLGEITFLAYSAHFDKDVISTWSSGTGGAGVLGALSYAAMASVLSPEKTLLVMLFVPVLMAISFWGVLVHPKLRRDEKTADEAIPDEEPLLPCSGCTGYAKVTLTFGDKLRLIKLELIVFRNTKLSHKEQYRWLQVMYQVGVLISRSSVNFIQIRKLWILPILQFINVAFIFSEAYLLFLPSFWIVVVVVLYEGLLGGSAYVNTFYRISQDVPIQHREFSLRIASLADSAGIAIAGAMALPTHDAMCRLKY